MARYSFFLLIVFASCSSALPRDTVIPPCEPAKFASPAEAAEALNRAVVTENKESLVEILGSQGAELVATGNPAKDRRKIEDLSRRMTEKHSLEAQPDGVYILSIGNNESPFPYPIVKNGDRWSFESAAK